jgi:hypothetical protein
MSRPWLTVLPEIPASFRAAKVQSRRLVQFEFVTVPTKGAGAAQKAEWWAGHDTACPDCFIARSAPVHHYRCHQRFKC